MNNNTTATRIKPRRCEFCGSDTYRGTYQAHLAAWHPSKARPMAQVTRPGYGVSPR